MNRWRIVALVGLLLGVAPAMSEPQGNLQPGSDPSVLPGPVLIADEGNDRIVLVDPQGRLLWTFPEPGDLRSGERFKSSDGAFYTPDGKQIIVTHEEDFTVTLVDPAARRIVWRYGTPGIRGHGPNQLWNPDDALVLPDGHVLAPDIKNCRILLIARGAQAPERIYGADRRPPGGLQARSTAHLRQSQRRLPHAERPLPGDRDPGAVDQRIRPPDGDGDQVLPPARGPVPIGHQ